MPLLLAPVIGILVWAFIWFSVLYTFVVVPLLLVILAPAAIFLRVGKCSTFFGNATDKTNGFIFGEHGAYMAAVQTWGGWLGSIGFWIALLTIAGYSLYRFGQGAEIRSNKSLNAAFMALPGPPGYEEEEEEYGELEDLGNDDYLLNRPDGLLKLNV
jgi:hypothetical protein